MPDDRAPVRQRIILVSTHRADQAHFAPLRKLLAADGDRFNLVDVMPDIAVVLGDRLEMLQQAAIWVERRVPLLHLHGGEVTLGSLDDRWRWAISMMADEHCVAHEEYGENLVDRKIPRTRIHITGAPGLDGIRRRKTIAVSHPFVVVLYNPVISRRQTEQEVGAIREAIEAQGWNVLWIGPNGDRYSDVIWQGDEMPHETFRDYLANADVIVGNSSAGIIEAPSLGVWSVNVGARQDGRLRAPSVIDIEPDAALIRDRITWAIEKGRAPNENPYNTDGHACERIRDVLLRMHR